MMRPVLLDTHVVIWTAKQTGMLSATAYGYVHGGGELFLSDVSVWEMAIKLNTGKLNLRDSLPVFVSKATAKYSLTELPVTLNHIYKTLEMVLHHRDPFDRMLVAQALHEGLPIVSVDTALDAYGIERIW